MGADVSIFDRRTDQYPDGRIQIPFRKGPEMYMAYNRQIARLIRDIQSDLIYAADIDVMPGIMWGLGSRPSIPVILDLHEYFPEVIELQERPLKQWIWRVVERRSVAYASEVMTVNHSLARIYHSKYHKEIQTIRNVPWLDPGDEVQVGDRLKNKILYYQGAINEGRGLEKLIQSLLYLPEWKLWLVGDGDVFSDLKKIVSRLSVESRVVFWGRKRPSDLPGLASQATIGFNLLESRAGSYYYSLANKYFEYMHALLPAVHMNFPEYLALFQELKVGSLLTDIKPEKIAQAVMDITGDMRQYEFYIEQCRLGRERYNWQMESEALKLIIKKLLPSGHFEHTE